MSCISTRSFAACVFKGHRQSELKRYVFGCDGSVRQALFRKYPMISVLSRMVYQGTGEICDSGCTHRVAKSILLRH
jgi:hypothetical protein